MGLNPTSEVPVITDTDTVLWFGRYRNLTVGEVLADDPDYLAWCQYNVPGFDLHYTLLEVAERFTGSDTVWEIQSEYFWR